MQEIHLARLTNQIFNTRCTSNFTVCFGVFKYTNNQAASLKLPYVKFEHKLKTSDAKKVMNMQINHNLLKLLYNENELMRNN